MKKLLFIAIFLISNILIGQGENEKFTIEKGLWNIEGNFSLNFRNSKNYDYDLKYFNLGFFPKLGYSINDNLIIGIGLGYQYSKTEDENTQNFNNESTINRYSIYPYIKKYIPLGKKLAFHVQGEAKYSNFKNKDESTDDEYKNYSFFIGLRPGISYYLSEKILLQTNFGAFRI